MQPLDKSLIMASVIMTDMCYFEVKPDKNQQQYWMFEY